MLGKICSKLSVITPEHQSQKKNSSKEEISMEITLKLNARFQPVHRFELEDALQEILEKKYGDSDRRRDSPES